MTALRRLGLAMLACAGLAAPAAAQTCPVVPDDVFAFINAGSDECPASPEVFWTDAAVPYDCSFFADEANGIDCSGDAGTCIALCKDAANAWNADLPGRFTFVDADDTVTFCDTEDGKVSIGGTTTLCDGTTYGSRVLAVTLSIFFSGGPQAGQLIDANITVNQAFQFSQPGFQATLAHELGHALGLSHPDQCGDDFNVLMRSASLFTPQSNCFVRDPTTADVRGAERIYPVVNPTPTPNPTPGICGDADLSGAVTVTDGVQVLRAAAGLSSDCTAARCDVDSSGAITVTDGVNVLRNAAGLSSISTCP
ncbi:MAG: hypothetical protein IT293_04365 [Deltaproteobacteria bacterium]|nr:hypothetical protein [Deltaproteobacteria bacterium]